MVLVECMNDVCLLSLCAGGISALKSMACRYGLQSEAVLKAIEGLEGVEACKEYSYVREGRSFRVHLAKLRDAAKKVHSKKMNTRTGVGTCPTALPLESTILLLSVQICDHARRMYAEFNLISLA